MKAANRDPSWSPAMGFEPFVGPEYREGLSGGLKVLLLGESHWDKEGTGGRDFTKSEYSDYIQSDYQLRPPNEFFGKLQRIAARNERATAEDSVAAWKRVAFMNFLQIAVGPSAAYRPTREIWQTGPPALSEAIQKLQPDVVLVMGKLVWNRINEGEASGLAHIPAPRQEREVWLIRHGAGIAHCSWIYHPARNLDSIASAVAVFTALLEIAACARGHAARGQDA